MKTIRVLLLFFIVAVYGQSEFDYTTNGLNWNGTCKTV